MASGKLLAVLCLGIVMLAGGSTKAVAQCNCPGGSPPPVTDCVGDETVCGRWAAIIDCPSPAGAYGAPPWPACWPFNVEGIHAVLTHTGRVLVFNQTIPLSDCFWNGSAMAHFWDPGEFNVRPPANDIMVYSSDIVNSHKNLFCSGHAVLPDGRIIVVGGTDAGQLGGTYGTTTTFLFDPQGSSHLGCNRGCPTQPSPWRCMDWTELSPSPTMQYRRWYPTVTVLPNGQVLAVAGQESNVGGVIDMAEIPERFDRIVNSWTQFSGAANDQPPAGNMDVWYPLMFVLPGSTTSSSYVLHAGPQRTVTGFPTGHMQTIGNLQGASPTWANFGSASQIDGGGAVLYDKGRILKNGSPPTETFGTDAIKTGELINVKLDGSADTFAAAAPMLMERNQHNLVVLPDGTVFCSGGAVKIGGDNVCCEWRVLDSEIWTPGQDPTDPGSWRRVDAMNHRNPVHPRIYHSNALLLPDGRVLSTGGECKISPCSNTHYKSADFYEPPYLWEGPTDPIEPADRPTITSPPQFVAYGEAMFFQVSCVTCHIILHPVVRLHSDMVSGISA